MALTIDKDAVLLIAPELSVSSLTDDMWTQQLGWAGDEISSAVGDQASQDRCGTYLVAHQMTMLKLGADGAGGAAGPAGTLQSVKVGQVEKAYAVPKAFSELSLTAAVLATTRYGREYLRLIRIFAGGSGMVSGGLGPVLPGDSGSLL